MPDPKPIVPRELAPPASWPAHEDRLHAPLRFSFDLDMLAPLGDGPGNLADWFPRLSEGTSSLRAGDATLLLEADAWLTQATCRPPGDVSPPLLALILLNSAIIERGQAMSDHDGAWKELQRSLRLGRLLLQCDECSFVYSIALRQVYLSLRAMHERARHDSSLERLVAVTTALAETQSMQRALWARNGLAFAIAIRAGRQGRLATLLGPSVEVSDDELTSLEDTALHETTPCLRRDAIESLHHVLHGGTRAQRKRADAALASLAADGDPRVVALAAHYRAAKWERPLVITKYE